MFVQRSWPLVRRNVSTTSLMAGSTRSRAESLRTHTPPAPTSTSVGVTPSPMVSTTSRDLGSIRKRVLSSRLPTQTAASRPQARPVSRRRESDRRSCPFQDRRQRPSRPRASRPSVSGQKGRERRQPHLLRSRARAPWQERESRVGNRRTVSIRSSSRAQGSLGASSDGSWRRIARSSARRRGPGSIPSSTLNVCRARRYVSSASPDDRFGRERASAGRADPRGRDARRRGFRARRQASRGVRGRGLRRSGPRAPSIGAPPDGRSRSGRIARRRGPQVQVPARVRAHPGASAKRVLAHRPRAAADPAPAEPRSAVRRARPAEHAARNPRRA